MVFVASFVNSGASGKNCVFALKGEFAQLFDCGICDTLGYIVHVDQRNVRKRMTCAIVSCSRV